MKSVLISIRPKWVEKIANGQKTIEVRKSAPKEVPFKCYIYCTIGNGVKGDYLVPSGIQCGKVIGEFICDKVDKIIPLRHAYYNYIGSPIANVIEYGIWNDDLAQMCLKKKEIDNDGKGKMLYGWHISNLKIYDKPKELSEFGQKCDNANEIRCRDCRLLEEWDNCCSVMCKPLTRAPSNWCYVEELPK